MRKCAGASSPAQGNVGAGCRREDGQNSRNDFSLDSPFIERRHAPDREQRGFHPRDLAVIRLNARRLMAGVRLLLNWEVSRMRRRYDLWSVPFVLSVFLTFSAPSHGQATDWAVVGLSVYSGPPEGRTLVITDVKVAGVPIRFSRPFAAGDGWLRDMVVTVKNISARPMSTVKVLVTLELGRFEFILPKADGPDVGESPVLLPGDTGDLRLSEAPSVAGRTGSAEFEAARREVVTKARRITIGAAAIRFLGESNERVVYLVRVSERR
jgi:hypothetical protein